MMPRTWGREEIAQWERREQWAWCWRLTVKGAWWLAVIAGIYIACSAVIP